LLKDGVEKLAMRAITHRKFCRERREAIITNYKFLDPIKYSILRKLIYMVLSI